MFKVHGFNHKTGNYQGRDYDNFQLFGVTDDEWQMIKVPRKVVDNCGIKDYNLLKGALLDILYNRYGQVSEIRIGSK